MKYYKKLFPKVKLFGSDGTLIPFEILSFDIGVAAFDEVKDAEYIKIVDYFCRLNIGGVSEITAEEYEDLKKKMKEAGHTLTPHKTTAMKNFRIFNPSNPSEVEYVQSAMEQDIASLVGDTANPAVDVGEQVGPEMIPLVGRGKKVKTAKPKNLDNEKNSS